MIDKSAIAAWTEQAPWIYSTMVEQDLIICKALVCIFNDDFLASQLAFRGGTGMLPKVHGICGGEGPLL